MAINKVSSKPSKNHGGLRNVLEYALKDKVLKKAIDEGRAEYLGVHTQSTYRGRTTLLLYGLGGFTFHIIAPNGYQIKEEEYLGQIEEPISAEKTRPVSMNFTIAKKMLEKYIEQD